MSLFGRNTLSHRWRRQHRARSPKMRSEGRLLEEVARSSSTATRICQHIVRVVGLLVPGQAQQLLHTRLDQPHPSDELYNGTGLHMSIAMSRLHGQDAGWPGVCSFLHASLTALLPLALKAPEVNKVARHEDFKVPSSWHVRAFPDTANPRRPFHWPLAFVPSGGICLRDAAGGFQRDAVRPGQTVYQPGLVPFPAFTGMASIPSPALADSMCGHPVPKWQCAPMPDGPGHTCS